MRITPPWLVSLPLLVASACAAPAMPPHMAFSRHLAPIEDELSARDSASPTSFGEARPPWSEQHRRVPRRGHGPSAVNGPKGVALCGFC